MKHVYEGELTLEDVHYEGVFISVDGVSFGAELLRIFDHAKDDDKFLTTYKCGPVRITVEQLEEKT